MTKQHFSVPIYIDNYLVTGTASDCQYKLTKLSDDEMCAHRILANRLAKDGEAEECELCALAEEFDDTLDENENPDEEGENANETNVSDINVQREMERIHKEEAIINKHQKIQDQITADSKIITDNIAKQKQNVELVLQICEQSKETDGDFLDQTSMTYFDN